MKLIHPKIFAAGCFGILSFLGAIRAQDAQPIVVTPYSKEFIFFAGDNHSIYVVTRQEKEAGAEKSGVALDSFTIGLGVLPADLRELPEVKLDLQGMKYVMPARKVVMIASKPTQEGIFVQAALDPNGTGNYEVMLTINSTDWPDADKKPEFLRRILPETLEVIDDSSSWSRPKGGLNWTATLIFHNRTGRPFTLETGYFENLPTTEGWPVIEIPPAN